MTDREPLYGKNPQELAALCNELGLPRFAARQIARWLYVRHTEDPLRMTDLSAANRQRLAERFTPVLSAPERETRSADGTKKYLFRTLEGHFIESAYIPDGDRATLCVSSQAGCRMGCRFCATGRQGLQQPCRPKQIRRRKPRRLLLFLGHPILCRLPYSPPPLSPGLPQPPPCRLPWRQAPQWRLQAGTQTIGS